eukprot:6178865-Pleurochrysis_carterae.AAC.2
MAVGKRQLTMKVSAGIQSLFSPCPSAVLEPIADVWTLSATHGAHSARAGRVRGPRRLEAKLALLPRLEGRGVDGADGGLAQHLERQDPKRLLAATQIKVKSSGLGLSLDL